MNIITLVLDFFYEIFYGWNSAQAGGADNSKRWHFRGGELIAPHRASA